MPDVQWVFLGTGEPRYHQLLADLAAGNPYEDGVAGDPRVWALGLRNPYRIAIQPETDNVFIAEAPLDNRDSSLRPGMKGRARIITSRHFRRRAHASGS